MTNTSFGAGFISVPEVFFACSLSHAHMQRIFASGKQGFLHACMQRKDCLFEVYLRSKYVYGEKRDMSMERSEIRMRTALYEFE